MNKTFSGFLQNAGTRYWTASVLPALVGTTLPFWLRPPGFSFKVIEAIEFLAATVLIHAGFSLLHTQFDDKVKPGWSKLRFYGTAILCLSAAILIGLHLNHSLQLNKHVHESIFILYGIGTIFAGVLYVVPPFRFSHRVGGEVIISVGLGMMPVLGAYIIQAGDLTRTVYLASLPLVVSTGLWAWLSELISRSDDESSGYTTMVMLFPEHFARGIVTPFLSILVYLTLVLAVFGRSSLNPLALTCMFSIGFALKIISLVRNKDTTIREIHKAQTYAFLIHIVFCLIIIISSLSTIIF